ncbi:MAG: BRO family protein [Rhodopila sp.]|nr:BRO family protein [Rhodopila sp.]
MTDDRITPFLFDGDIIVRVIGINGIPWFVASDVCRALGLTNPTETVSSLDEDEKGISRADTLGGQQEVIIISESGVYVLIFKSREPHAVRFRKWVTSEVLPALRERGHYVAGEVTAVRKPYAEWSLEERRTALAEVDTARKSLGRGSAAWMWEFLGFPIPPRHLLPGWWQGDMLG